MGACVSTPGVEFKPSKSMKMRKQGQSKKRPDGNRKKNGDAGARVTDIAVSEFVSTTTTCRRSASNSTYQITQLIDAKGLYHEDSWFDTVSMLESDSDDEFDSVYGDFYHAIANGELVDSNFLEYHEKYLLRHNMSNGNMDDFGN